MDNFERNMAWRRNTVIKPIIEQVENLLRDVEFRDWNQHTAVIPRGFHMVWAKVLNNPELSIPALLSLRRTAMMIHINTFKGKED